MDWLPLVRGIGGIEIRLPFRNEGSKKVKFGNSLGIDSEAHAVVAKGMETKTVSTEVEPSRRVEFIAV
jgi:hypothetical protein